MGMMTKLSPKAHAIMEAYYNIDTTEEDGIVALLRVLVNQFNDWGGDEPSCCVFREIVDIIDELEQFFGSGIR